jgi:hypothetical protein
MRTVRLPTALAAALVLAAAAAARAGSADVSTNWSGYAATGAAFSAVSAGWVQPSAECLTRTTSETQAFFWVGLGGDLESSGKLEQIGTEADCASSGAARYSAWYELWPGSPVRIGLRVSPGDRMWASVRVRERDVMLVLRNLTTGERFGRTVTTSSPDTSSAEWIVEAPTAVLSGGDQIIPLTNFGTVTFSKAKATSTRGHTGTISDHAWKGRPVSLASEGSSRASPLAQFVDEVTAVRIAPTTLARGGSSFAVEWRRSPHSAPGKAGTA